MVAILDRKFTGEVPRLPPAYRPPGSATTATNCDFSLGDLRPLRADKSYGSLTLNATASAVRGLFYSREIGKVLHFPTAVSVTRHTAAGVDRLYATDGVAPLVTGKISTYASSADVLASSAIGFGAVGPQAPEYTPQPMGDLKLSDYYMAGRPISDLSESNPYRIHADAIAYNLRTYWAIRSKTGALGPFYPSNRNTEDVISPGVVRFSEALNFVESSAVSVSANALADWQKATGFWNKYRDLKGSVYLADGEDIVLMVKVYRVVQSAHTTTNSGSTEVPLGVAYSSNYNGGGGSITASSGAASSGTDTNAGNAGSSGYQYPTVAEFPEFDTWKTSDLTGLAWNAHVLQGNEERVFDYSRALAAMSVLYARGNSSFFTHNGTNFAYADYLGQAERDRLNAKTSSRTVMAAQQGASASTETTVQATSTTDATSTTTGKAGSYTVTFVSSREPARDASGNLLNKDASGRTLYALKASLQIGNVDSRSYCYTFVNEFGEESMPSPASRVITIDQGHCVRVSIDPPAGWKAAAQTFSGYACNPSSYGSTQRENAYGLPIVRIYRTVTASSGETRYHLFREVCFAEYICTPLGHRAYFDHPLSPADIARPFASNYQWFDYIDQLDDKQAKEPLSTVGYRPPPGSLTHLQPFGNNMLCGVAGDELCFSEPLHPYAWPVRNRVKVSSRIRAAETTANGVLLATEDGFSIATGGDASTMAVHKLPSSSVLVGSSFARMGEALVAPTTDGLAVINGATVSTDLSEKFWTPDIWGTQWVASSSSKTTETIGRYVGTFAHNKRLLVAGTTGSFVVDLTTGSLSRVSTGYSAGHYANALDALLVSPYVTGVGINVYLFAEATFYRQMDYFSRVFTFERPLSMGAIKVVVGGSFPNESAGMADLSSLVYVQCYVGNEWITVTGTDGAPYLKVGVDSANNASANSNVGFAPANSEYHARLRGGYLSTRWRYRVVGYTAIREIHIAETMREVQHA